MSGGHPQLGLDRPRITTHSHTTLDPTNTECVLARSLFLTKREAAEEQHTSRTQLRASTKMPNTSLLLHASGLGQRLKQMAGIMPKVLEHRHSMLLYFSMKLQSELALVKFKYVY